MFIGNSNIETVMLSHSIYNGAVRGTKYTIQQQMERLYKANVAPTVHLANSELLTVGEMDGRVGIRALEHGRPRHEGAVARER